MGRKNWKKQRQSNKIAKERIAILFNHVKDNEELSSVKNSVGADELAQRYVFIARKLAMRIRKPLPWEYKRYFCRSCNSSLVRGGNVRVRIKGKKNNAHVVVTCLTCGRVYRYNLNRGKRKTRGNDKGKGKDIQT
ncbi:MAG: ribonuclease P protein component 4 [Promethearchaeota archaeon]